MESTDSSGGRRIPGWAADVIAILSRTTPPVVTRQDIADLLAEVGSSRNVDATIRELRRLGWLVRNPTAGTWAFLPPGQDEIIDPYLPLRAWRAADPESGMRLAGEAAAWHLGYLDRAPEGKVQVWLPARTRLPDGLRGHVRVVRLRWDDDQLDQVEPDARLLLRRRLDLLSWSSGLPAFGPEAVIVQLATRPSSFRPWADLMAHLDELVEDTDDQRLAVLLRGQSTAAWQRAAYLLHAGGHPPRGIALFDRRPRRTVPKTQFHPSIDDPDRPSLYVAQYALIDQLIAPMQGVIGKA